MQKRKRAPVKEVAATRKVSRKRQQIYSNRPFVPENMAGPTSDLLADCAHRVFDNCDHNSGIYLGPKQCCVAAVLSVLRLSQVTGIVNCTLDAPCAHEAKGIEYCRVPVRDHEAANIYLFFEGASAFIHRHLTRGGSVVVHCEMGVSRSASIVLAYLMRYQSMSRDTAYTRVKSRRPQVCILWNYTRRYTRLL